jgi:hypothetical protein
MIAGKSREKVARSCQNLPESTRICQKWTKVDTSLLFERLFQVNGGNG